MRILDLQDLHSLRLKRQELSSLTPAALNTSTVLQARPNPQEDSYAARELASIYRSDLIITCSDYEEFLIKSHYKIENTALITFFQTDLNDPEHQEKQKNYDNRRHFVWLGNFAHQANFDAVGFLVKDIWPKISERLPEAELHVYGANFRKEFSGLEKNDKSIRSMVFLSFLEFFEKARNSEENNEIS